MNTVPEVWTVVVDRGSVATLTVPPHLNRQRVFDVDAVLLARIPAEGRPASFSLSVEVDGALQWTRTVPGQTPGEVDTLEYHCRVSVDATRQLRLRARSALSECSLQQLRLTAAEASD